MMTFQSWFHSTLVAAFCALAASSISAQSPSQAFNLTPDDQRWLDDITLPRRGECSGDEKVRRLARRHRAFTILPPSYAHPDFSSDPFTRNSALAARPMDEEAHPDAFTRVGVVGVASNGQRALIRWESGSDVQCAWAALQWLTQLVRDGQSLRTPKPLQMREGPLKDRQQFQDSTLNMKVVTQPLRLESKTAQIQFSEAPGGPPGAATALFDVFDVFSYATTLDTSGVEQRWYLIGQAVPGSTSLQGWVQEQNFFVWPSRLALFWAKTGQAKCSFAGGRSDEELILEPSAVLEPDGTLSKRFPIFGEDLNPTSGELAVEADPLKFVPMTETLKGISRYHVIIPGEACSTDNPQDCRSAASIDAARNAVAQQISNLNNVDVLFLIDGTGTMKDYFPLASEAVEDIVQSYEVGNQSMRVGISFYSDYTGSRPSLQEMTYRQVVDMQFVGVGLNFEGAPRFPPLEDVQKDIEEASIAAVMRAEATTPWRDDAGIKVIIHIADHGSRPVGQTSGKSALEEVFGPEMLARLIEQRKNLMYVPIAVRGTYRKKQNDLFVEQSREVSRLVVDRAIAPKVTYSANSSSDLGEARGRIKEALREALNVVELGRQGIKDKILCVGSADPATCRPPAATAGSASARIAQSLVDDILPDDLLNNIYGRTQTVVKGYCKPLSDGGESLFTYWVAFDPQNFGSLVDKVEKLCDRFDRMDHGVIKDLFVDQATGTTGDYASFSDLLQKVYHIPTLGMHPLLKLSPDDMIFHLEDLAADQSTRPQFDEAKKYFCRRAMLLRRADAQERLKEGRTIEWDATTRRFLSSDRDWEKFEWAPEVDSGARLFYVPLEFLP